MTNEELVNLIYISIETEGADFQKLCDLVDVTGVGMREEPEKRATYFKVSNYAADYARYMYGQGNGEKFELLFQKAKCNEAPFYFDSYLQYLEHRRIYENRFYEPRRDCLLKIGVIQAMQDLEDDKLDILCISMPPGSGKAQPANSKLLTPNGFMRFGDAKIGQKVIAGNGKIAEIVGLFPQGERDIYEVTFDDGSCCRVSDNHLWYAQTRDDRRRGNKYRVIETSKMLKNFKVENGKRCNYSIDYVPEIDMKPDKSLKIRPYLLGVLIGDGGLTDNTIKISTPDDEILAKISKCLPIGYELKHIQKYDYAIKGHYGVGNHQGQIIKDYLKDCGLLGLHSYEKHIPREYLTASYSQRLELLRGLMDTDGSSEKCEATYSTSSKQLAEDVKELVHSLGGYCSMAIKKNCGYKDSDGNFIKCRDSYRLTIQFSSKQPNPFSLSRKAAAYKPKRTELKRYITNIEYIEKEECTCILIDDPCHLYITDDYIITHNTTLEKFFASWVIGRHPDDYSLFFSHSGDITRMFYDGVLDITNNPVEYAFNDVFPDVQYTQKGSNAKMESLNFNKYKPFANLQCTSIGSKNAGKVRCNQYLYCDDLIGGIEEALNKAYLAKLWGIYTTDAKQRKVPKMDGRPCKEIHIATRWSTMDVIGRLQAVYGDDPRAKFIAIPDIDEETGESNFMYEVGGMSTQFFNDIALTMDDISYQCLYKNKPIEREGLLYTDEEVRRYLTLPLDPPDAIVGVCDTKRTGTDYFVMVCFAQYGMDFYLLDVVCDNTTNYDLQYEKCTALILENKMQQMQFESNQGGDRVALEVAKRVDERNGICNITTKHTQENKETKIIINADWIKKHCLFKDKSLIVRKSDYDIFMKQLFSYSTVGKNNHDDVPDALAMFAMYMNNLMAPANKVEIISRALLGI